MKKVMLITGASRGIGATTAEMAAKQGYKVLINYHSNQSAADHLVKKIKDSGGDAFAVASDVSKEDEVMALFNALDQQYGRLDVLVNNAGILAKQMPLVEMSAARLEQVLGINVIGSFLCAREAIKRMSTRRGGAGGSIVNISSIASRLGSPNEYIDYAAAKGAIDSMTIGLSKEVAVDGIRVNAVRPGMIHTEIHASGGEPGRIERLKSFVPMGRGGDTEEVAHAILWLASTQASYVTGSLLDVSGGR